MTPVWIATYLPLALYVKCHFATNTVVKFGVRIAMVHPVIITLVFIVISALTTPDNAVVPTVNLVTNQSVNNVIHVARNVAKTLA